MYKDKIGKHVWSGDLPDGSHVEFREHNNKLHRYYRVFNPRTGKPEWDLVFDDKFNESTSCELYQILKKLSNVETSYSASLWKDDER